MRKLKGFTLIELLIVIAIIAIIAAVVFVALDPLTRFRDARDSARWQDISALMSAIKVDQVDNGGSYLAEITALDDGDVYMIGTAADCDAANDYCDTNVTAEVVAGDHCVDLGNLVTEGYLGALPTSPDGEGTWTSTLTGYTIQKDSTGIITVRACESENSPELTISR